MRDRARSICHPTKMQQEVDHLNQVFQVNGFPENLVKKTLMTHAPPLLVTSEPQQLDEAPKILHPLHQGAKREDSKGLCPSGSEACLQTKENSEKRTNAGEEQGPRAETDRIAQRCTWEKPRGH